MQNNQTHTQNTSTIDAPKYSVVVNEEEQYSVWPNSKDLPLGWSRVNIPQSWLNNYQIQKPECDPQSQSTCLAYIESVWTDMRPLSLRKQLI